MEEIGYDLYVKLLNQAIRSKMGDKVEEDFDTSVDLPVDAYIPDEYVRNEYLKLELYKRISHIENEDDIADITAEAEDRFGEVPKTMKRLMRVAVIKAKAHNACLTFVRYRNGLAEYIVRDGAPIDVARIDRFVRGYKGRMHIIATKESGFAVKTSSLIQDQMLDDVESVIEAIDRELIIKED